MTVDKDEMSMGSKEFCALSVSKLDYQKCTVKIICCRLDDYLVTYYSAISPELTAPSTSVALQLRNNDSQ